MTLAILRDWILIITGLLNLGASVYALISVSRVHALSRGARINKYALIVALALYVSLETRWLTLGTYHIANWNPVLWGLMDTLWILCIAWMSQRGADDMHRAAQRLMRLSDKLDKLNAHE